MMVKPCDICGEPMELNESGPNRRRRKRHSGTCTREYTRRNSARYNAENRAPVQYAGQDPEQVKPYTLKAFADFCLTLTTDHQEPLRLEPFQKRMLAGHFSDATETVIVIPKGNGKTTLLSALAVFHMLNVPDAEVIIAAASRDQARILFKQAAALVKRSHLDQLEVKAGYGEIRFEGDRARVGPRIRVIASDATTADGVIPTLALVDELHRHRDGDLYGVFRDGLGKLGGRMLTISTAGYESGSALGKLRAMAHNLPTFKRVGCHNHATGPSFEWHEWCLTDEDDTSDMKLVKKANPASFVTLDWLKRRYESPSTTPPQWARFACGVWTSGENPWLTPTEWDSLKWFGVEPGDEVYVGVRIGAEVGIGLAARTPGARVRRGAEGLSEITSDTVAVKMVPLSAPAGSRVPLRVVEDVLRELAQEYRVLDVAYDPDHFQRSAELLMQEGLPMTEMFQSPKRLTMATATFWGLVSSRQLSHDGDPELRRQVLSGRTKETQQGWRLEPTADTAGLIAVLMATHQATDMPPETPAFVAI